jgi:RND family efflux transporter MFP subunit
MTRYILPIIIVCITALGIWYVKGNAPQPKKRPTAQAVSIPVETQQITATPVQLKLQSFGRISAKTTSTLTSQVSGLVVSVNPQFEEGAFFKKGDILLSLDNRDFQSAINSAKADLTQTQQDLALEKAQVSQAKADWNRLNKGKTIPPLVSRTPQILQAKAKVSAAHARYNQAILNFKRTKITAPFDGRVLSKTASIGDYINANSALANLMTSASLQVRLSLKNSDLAFIDLPEQNIQQANDNRSYPAVSFTTNLIEEQSWPGEIVRTEPSIDSSSQQLFVIGEIYQPFSSQHRDKYPLKIGQYVNAIIEGKKITDARQINIKNIYQDQFVFILKEGQVTRRDITISWQNESVALVGKGLDIGDELITSALTLDDEGSLAKPKEPK